MEPDQVVRISDAHQFLDDANSIYVWLALSRDDNKPWVLRTLIMDVLPQRWLANPNSNFPLLGPWPVNPEVHPFANAFFYSGLLPRDAVQGWFDRPKDCTLYGLGSGPAQSTWAISFALPDFYPDAQKQHIVSHGPSLTRAIPYPCYVYRFTPIAMPNAQIDGRSKDYFPLVNDATDDDFQNFRHARAELLYGVSSQVEAQQRDDVVAVRVVDARGWLQEIRVLPDKVAVTVGGIGFVGSSSVKLSGDKFRDNQPLFDHHSTLALNQPLPDLVTVRLVKGQEVLDEAEFTSDAYAWPHKSPQVIVEREGFYGHKPPASATPTYPPADVIAAKQAGESPQPKVFVSHSHVDDAFAERLVKDLRAAGADAWLDKEELGAGDFQERIDAALASCEWFVLILTRSALASPWVQQEVRAANRLKHQRRIRDLLFIQASPVEQHELPPMWGVYNVIDAASDYGAALAKMLGEIGLSRPATSPHPAQVSQETSNGNPDPLSEYRITRQRREHPPTVSLSAAESLLSEGRYEEALEMFDEIAQKVVDHKRMAGPFMSPSNREQGIEDYIRAHMGKYKALLQLGRTQEAAGAMGRAQQVAQQGFI